MEDVNIKQPPDRVDLDDVKMAAPVEADAVASILTSIDENEALVQQTQVIKGVEPRKSSIVLDNATKQNSLQSSTRRDDLSSVAKKLQAVHRKASVAQLLQESGPEKQNSSNEQSQEKSQLDDTINSGGMNTTTNKLLQTANVLVNLHHRSKEKKEPSEGQNDIESGGHNVNEPSGNDETVHPKKSDAVDPSSPKNGFYKEAKEEIENLYRVLQPERRSMRRAIKYATIVILFLFMISVITFYALKETKTLCLQTEEDSEECTTVSWFCLFVIRQIITLIAAVLIQHLVIDVMCLRLPCLQRLLGPLVILGIIQSKGWPFVVSIWAILDFLVLYGSEKWVKHWLYWQNIWGLFNEENPAGYVTASKDYRNILLGLLFLGIAASLKRVVFGLMFGKKTFQNYNKQVTHVMHSILLVSQVANLAKEIEVAGITGGSLHVDLDAGDGDSESEDENAASRSLTLTQRTKITEMVGDWEEPEVESYDSSKIGIGDIIQFSQTLACINNHFPFTYAFGNARTREACIESAQDVFDRFKRHTQSVGRGIRFEVIARVACGATGNIDQKEAKRLIRLFRPSRDGTLEKIDFVKSCDNVYKELRLMQASIANSTQIDDASEKLYNIAFYLIYLFLFLLGIRGAEDSYQFFLQLFAVITPLSFAIKSACGKYVEGVMLILFRKPFEIGDRVALADVYADASLTGASTWFVENVNLFTTTVRYAVTNEVACIANSSFVDNRIINAKRSPNALIRINLRFGVGVQRSKIDLFYKTVQEYAKDRPREFLQLNNLSASSIEVERGYVEYILVAQHVESWQQMGQVWKSQVDLTRFCHELSTRLLMKYENPCLPIELEIDKGDSNSEDDSEFPQDFTADLFSKRVKRPVTYRAEGGDD
mmetsp:Transcript_11377/g.17454  ORF Transcript_11377/g.17454 Transcript_11377/m.17454 type:complete len:883 (+) Transcript_11377:72-2720(+)